MEDLGLGLVLVAVGAWGFHELDGMVAADAGGDPWINAVYCSVITLTTVGYGDICPAAPGNEGKVFLIALSFAGLGFFCGPIMDLTASWSSSVPGGKLGVVITTLGLGVAMFTQLEGWTPLDALYYSTITGTTIGYGDQIPHPSRQASRCIVCTYRRQRCGGTSGPSQGCADELCDEWGGDTDSVDKTIVAPSRGMSSRVRRSTKTLRKMQCAKEDEE